MSVHDRCLRLVAARIDFELSEAEMAAVDRHLATCVACRRDGAGIAGDAATIAALPQPQRGPARIAAQAVRGAPQPFGRPSARLVAIAAMLALLALGAITVGG